MAAVFIALLTLTVIFILAKYLEKLNYWKHNNVETINIIKTFNSSRRSHLALVLNSIYQNMYIAGKPFAVFETLFNSAVIVQNQDAIRDIMITRYEHFPDRGLYVNRQDALSTNLLRLHYEMWKPLRQKFSPAFSPAKMKFMFPTLLNVAEQLVEVLKNQIDAGNNIMDIHDLCGRFTTDVIGNVAFGIECNSLKQPNSEFRTYGVKSLRTKSHPFLDIMGSKYPKLFELLNFRTFKTEITEFFTNLVRQTMEYREQHSVRCNDFMDILIELRKNPKTAKDFSLEVVVGQVFIFFVGGFETSSSTLAYVLYELAKNQDIQEKSRDSVFEMLKENGIITYESLKHLTYLKQVIQETLRMYPIGPTTTRICRRSCKIQTCKGTYNIPKGATIMIPIYGIHYNPAYYADPYRFRPERFAEDETTQRPSCTYMPFGAGPRVCIGEHFAKMQLMLALALLLTNFRFSMCEKTCVSLIFDPSNVTLLTVKDGIYLKVDTL